VRFVLRRLVLVIPVLLIISFLTFAMMRLLPSSPLIFSLGPLYLPEDERAVCDEPNLQETDPQTALACEKTAEGEERLGLDQGIVAGYFDWLGNALHGDFGESYKNGVPVSDTISEKLPTSITLMIFAQILAFMFAIPLALIAAYRSGGWFDRITSGLSFAIISVAPFIMGLVLLFIFGVRLGWFPTLYDESEDLFGRLRGMFLGALTLGLGLGAVYQRLLRGDLVSTLQEDFILMAKAKGMPSRRIMLRHALRPSTFSLLTVIGIQIGALIGGAVVVEVTFGIRGIGYEIVQAIFSREYQMVQAVVLLLATVFIISNLIVDVIYGMLDPRVRDVRALN
jgi:peptide/nickel transport system permease protein